MEQFFTSLFDFSFKRFITPSLIRVLYILSVVGAGLAAIGMILQGFRSGIVSGLIAVILAPIIFVVSVCLYRVLLETILNVFRIANYAAELARATRKKNDQSLDAGLPTPPGAEDGF